MNKKIGFIGCGKMASAIIEGVLASNFVNKNDIQASQKDINKAQENSKKFGITISTDNTQVAKFADIIFIATVPAVAETVLNEIKPYVTPDKLIVSIAAGITTNFMQNILPEKSKVVRVMPNTPALICEGMSGIASGKFATKEDVDFVVKLLSNIGKCIVVDEPQIDIVTAISGSGPAFYYKVINEIARAGEKLGMDYEKALTLSIQTAIGSAKMLLNSDKSAEDLIASVATKGGCTRVGVDYMDEAKSSELFYNLIDKTAQKAHNLGK